MSASPPKLPEKPLAAVPATEGIKYAGSKRKLLPHILQLARKVQPRTVLDGFSGTTRVAQMFAQTGHRVIANDLSVWSQIFGQCYLCNSYPTSHYEPLIAHLNALPGVDGWFTEHYGGEPAAGITTTANGRKKPWQRHNTRRLDAIRAEIDRLGLTEVERAVLLTSLILALDEVDSTLGHFASYLSDWSPRSFRPLRLQVPRLFPIEQPHTVHRGDIFEVLPRIEADLAYFDPPYGSNNEKMPPSRVRYAAYYHLWTTICLNDRPAIFGKAGRRNDSSDKLAGSVFEDYRRNDAGRLVVVDAIAHLLQATRARHILLSYSSGGRATAEELHEVTTSVGRVIEVTEIDHRRNVMAGMRWTNEWIRDAEAPNTEFLFLIEKG
ncbi:DNA adenine methylase [Chthoniobacter flavus]|nr:DNA adenine methylase [Chthoniobacter flavus]